MHTVQNYKLIITKQVILVWQTGSYSKTTDNFEVEKLALKVHRICEEFTKILRRISKWCTQIFIFLAQNSDNPIHSISGLCSAVLYFRSCWVTVNYYNWNYNINICLAKTVSSVFDTDDWVPQRASGLKKYPTPAVSKAFLGGHFEHGHVGQPYL